MLPLDDIIIDGVYRHVDDPTRIVVVTDMRPTEDGMCVVYDIIGQGTTSSLSDSVFSKTYRWS
jgi:hypothetical protein